MELKGFLKLPAPFTTSLYRIHYMELKDPRVLLLHGINTFVVNPLHGVERREYSPRWLIGLGSNPLHGVESSSRNLLHAKRPNTRESITWS